MNDELRQAGRVLRYHTHPVLHPQSLAAHSHGVAMLCWGFYGETVSVNLLMAALTHDLAEKETGDLPAQVKWAHPELVKVLDKIEDDFAEKHGILFDLTIEETYLLKVADTLELMEYCFDERNLGNTGVQVIINRGKELLSKYAFDLGGLTPSPAVLSAMFLIEKVINKC